MEPIYLLVLALIGLVWGPWQIYVGIRDMKHGQDSLSWPTTTGIVMNVSPASFDTEDRRISYAKFSYKYSIEYQAISYCQEYIGHRVKCCNRKYSYAELWRYREGSNVTVYYHPRNPQNSVLEPGLVVRHNLRHIIFGICVSTFSIFYSVISIPLIAPWLLLAIMGGR